MIANRLNKYYYSIFILCSVLFTSKVEAQKNNILYAPNDNGITYTSLDEALRNPSQVYRLKLSSLPNCDSLPDELFQLTELRELTVKGCKLCIVNTRIGELTHLQYLNLDRNKLIRLPESIGKLSELHVLIISRNHIETLPNSICNLKELINIDAWDNQLYILPESIATLSGTLKTIDLRQIPFRKSEIEAMQKLLPNTEILFTDICECENHRDHD